MLLGEIKMIKVKTENKNDQTIKTGRETPQEADAGNKQSDETMRMITLQYKV